MATVLEQNILEANPRTAGNKNEARRVRVSGKIPAVVYGAGKDSLPVTVDPRQVQRILNSDSGHNTIFDLNLNGGERTKAMIVDWQYEPIKGKLLHIDVKRIAMDKALRVNVPVMLQGVPLGVSFWRFPAKQPAQPAHRLVIMVHDADVGKLPGVPPCF